MAHLTTTVWLLKIPAFLLTLMLLIHLSQNHSSFPLVLPFFLPRLLLLLRFSLARQTAMPLVLVEPLTFTTDLLAFMCFSFSEAQLSQPRLHDVPSNLGQRRLCWLRCRYRLHDTIRPVREAAFREDEQ